MSAVQRTIALVLGLLFTGAADWGVTRLQPYPITVSATVLNRRRNLPAQIQLERDHSLHWQQYLDSAPVAKTGEFSIQIQRPGLYWLLATEGSGKNARTGACLVEAHEDGAHRLLPVPRTTTGRKWGGAATRICRSGLVPLLERPAKKAAKRRGGIRPGRS